MGVKVKILGENKQKVDEGLGMLLDPTVMASIAVGLGVGVTFLQNMLGAADRRAIEGMSAQQAADYVDRVVYGSKSKAKAAKKKREAEQKSREEELKKLKAARDAKRSEEAPPLDNQPFNPDDQVSLRLGLGEEEPPAEISEEVIELYSDIVRKVRENTGIRSQADYDSASEDLKQKIDQRISSHASRIKKLNIYDENELKQLALQSGQIYENFKRFF